MTMRSCISTIFLLGFVLLLLLGTLARAGAFRKIVRGIANNWMVNEKPETAEQALTAALMIGLITDSDYYEILEEVGFGVVISHQPTELPR